MHDNDFVLEHRVEELGEEVHLLKDTVEKLNSQVQSLLATGIHPRAPYSGENTLSSSSSSIYPGAAVPLFLSEVATICFLLVVALALRTLVDSGFMNHGLGVLAGLAFASLLIAFGHLSYSRAKEAAPVYLVCGMILAFSITYEAHARFATLSTLSSHAILGVLLIVATFTGLRYGVSAPLVAGVMGVCVCGIALDFPDPSFPTLAVLLLLANTSSFLALRSHNSTGLSWFTFAVSAFFWLWWTTKIQAPLLHNESPPEALGTPLFLPCLLVFFFGYVLASVLLATKKLESAGLYGVVLPTANAVGAYFAALTMVEAAGGSVQTVAAVFVLLAVGHLGFSLWYGRSGWERVRGSATFLSAGAILLLLALPTAAGSIGAALLTWSCVALLLAVVGSLLRRTEALFIGNLLQGIVCMIAIVSGVFVSSPDLSASRLIFVIACGIVALLHYCLVTTSTRRSGELPSETSALFSRSSVLVLLSTLAYAFGGARMVLNATLVGLEGDSESSYQCGQSILINCGALMLLVLSLVKRDRDLFSVSYLVAGLGALKVFGYDLIYTHGGPLVLSVLSSGFVAAVSSFVWNHWQRESSPCDSGTVGTAPGECEAHLPRV